MIRGERDKGEVLELRDLSIVESWQRILVL